MANEEIKTIVEKRIHTDVMVCVSVHGGGGGESSEEIESRGGLGVRTKGTLGRRGQKGKSTCNTKPSHSVFHCLAQDHPYSFIGIACALCSDFFNSQVSMLYVSLWVKCDLR